MLIALCGDKGAPGVTTSALALAAAWPDPATVVEADPRGGDLAIRLHPNGSALPETPTVLTVATAARANHEPDLFSRYGHQLNSATNVVLGAIMAEQMANVGDWAPLAEALRRSTTPVLADLGHLHSASPMTDLAALADVVVVVARPDATSIIRIRERLVRLAIELGHRRGAPPRLFPLLVTTSRHGDADVGDLRSILAETTAKPFLAGAGFLAHDPPAVRRLESGEEPRGRLARTALLRTARMVTDQLAPLAADTSATTKPSASGSLR